MGVELVFVISERFADELAESPDVRNSFIAAQLRSFLTTQIRTIRTEQGISQEELAKMLGTSQSTIARLENREYGKFSLSTLIELAKAFDVALMVEFVTFKDFLIRTRNMSQSALSVDQFSREALDFLCSEENPSLLLIKGRSIEMHSDPAATNGSAVTMRRPTPNKEPVEMVLNMDSTPIQQQVA